MKWQPIETAPDGERVLVFSPGEELAVCEAIVDGGGRYYDPVYLEWDGRGATHWMPLPEPPKEIA